MYCRDLKQMMDEKGLGSDWKHNEAPKNDLLHNALDDARWNKRLFVQINSYTKTSEDITNDVMMLSPENTAGLLLSRESIFKVVKEALDHPGQVTENLINRWMFENESESGYLINVRDFIASFKKIEINTHKN